MKIFYTKHLLRLKAQLRLLLRIHYLAVVRNWLINCGDLLRLNKIGRWLLFWGLRVPLLVWFSLRRPNHFTDALVLVSVDSHWNITPTLVQLVSCRLVVGRSKWHQLLDLFCSLLILHLTYQLCLCFLSLLLWCLILLGASVGTSEGRVAIVSRPIDTFELFSWILSWLGSSYYPRREHSSCLVLPDILSEFLPHFMWPQQQVSTVI